MPREIVRADVCPRDGFIVEMIERNEQPTLTLRWSLGCLAFPAADREPLRTAMRRYNVLRKRDPFPFVVHSNVDGDWFNAVQWAVENY